MPSTPMSPSNSSTPPNGRYGRPLAGDLNDTETSPPDYEWGRLLKTIIVAGAVYPNLVLGVYAVLGALSVLTDLMSGAAVPGDRIAVMVAMLPIATVSSLVIGGAYAALVSMFALPSVWLTVRLLHISPRWDHLGTFAGGLVACVSILPFYGRQVSFDEVLLGGLAVLCGQVGGAYGGLLNLSARERRGIAPPASSGRMRISMRQILGLMVVVSVALALLRLLGLLTPSLAVSTLLWILFSALTHRPVIRIVKWRLDRPKRRAHWRHVVQLQDAYRKRVESRSVPHPAAGGPAAARSR